MKNVESSHTIQTKPTPESTVKPKTGLIDSIMNIFAGLLIHQLFLFFSLPALAFSLMARENNKQNKPIKAKTNARIAGKFNITCNILLLIYLIMRIVVIVIHLRGIENPLRNYQPPQNSILFNFLGYALRG
jgi:hypothetical protein